MQSWLKPAEREGSQQEQSVDCLIENFSEIVRARYITSRQQRYLNVWDSNDYIKTWLRSHRCASATQIRTASQKSTVKHEDPAWNSCRRMLILFELFGAAFLFVWCGNAGNAVPTKGNQECLTKKVQI